MFLIRQQRPSSLFDSFNTFDFGRESFEHPFFSDFFETSVLNAPTRRNELEVRKSKVNKRISKLKNEEQSLLSHIKHYESSVEEMKKAVEELAKHKIDLQKELEAIAVEEKTAAEKAAVSAQTAGSNTQNSKTNSSNIEQRIFKKSYYKTPEMEIEEQYDSTDPKKCFKIIRKEGEAPQILNTAETQAIENPNSQRSACCEHNTASTAPTSTPAPTAAQ